MFESMRRTRRAMGSDGLPDPGTASILDGKMHGNIEKSILEKILANGMLLGSLALALQAPVRMEPSGRRYSIDKSGKLD